MASRWLVLAAIPMLWAGFARAQAAAAPSCPALRERRILHDLACEQKRLWTSPLRLTRAQAPWLLLAGGLTAGLIATDRHVSAALPATGALVHESRLASNIGIGALITAAGGLYLDGWRSRAPPLRARGLLALESAADAGLVVEALKLATWRERPLEGSGHGHFWAGGDSFPSGHAALGWAVAESLAGSFPRHPWVRWSALGTAATLSVLRVTGQKHFPSDVLVGGLLGALVGHDLNTHAAAITLQPLAGVAPGGLGFAIRVRF